MSLFYSNPQGGRAGFFAIPCESVDAPTRLNCFIFVDFFHQTFAHFLQLTLAHFLNVVYFFNTILIFLWHINRFNVGHLNAFHPPNVRTDSLMPLSPPSTNLSSSAQCNYRQLDALSPPSTNLSSSALCKDSQRNAPAPTRNHTFICPM